MKKTVKSLMVALFVLGAMVMGISCQKDAPSMDKVEKDALVITAGNYELKATVSGSLSVGEVGVSMTVSEKMTMSAEVKGTDPDDEVVLSNGVMEMSQKMTFSDGDAYEMYKAMMKAQGAVKGVVFDDAKKSVNFEMTDKMDEDDENVTTYADFVDEIFDFAADGEDVENIEMFQSKDGSKAKFTFEMVMKSPYGNIPLKGTIELTRK